jgi:hypothetical protein
MTVPLSPHPFPISMLLPGEVAAKKHGRATPCEFAENNEINLQSFPSRIQP